MTIYYQDDRVTLHHGKAEDVLPTLPVGLIDVAITDPPYSRRPIKVAEVSVEGDVTRIRFAHSPLWTGHKSATRFHVSRKVA